jgi:ribonuclease D
MTNFLVDSDKKLSILSSKLHDITEIGLDTEFIRESTYRPILALIQISLPNGEIYLIDPLSIKKRELVGDFICNKDLIKIIHSSKQDIEALYSFTDTYPVNIFDTQIASNFLYEKSNPGYSSLVKTICDSDIKEGSWRTNWLERPLSDKKINYAADDVRYLIEIKKFLLEELIKLDRLSWFNEEQNRELEKSNIILNTKDAWEKINYPLYFSTADLKILKDIACWREQLAIKYNVPKRWILSDSLVIKVMLANTKKTDDILYNIKQQISDSEIKMIKNILKNKNQNKNKNINPNKDLENKYNEILNYVSDEFKIDSTIIANKRDLEFFSHFHDKARFMKGWRYKIFGKLVQ